MDKSDGLKQLNGRTEASGAKKSCARGRLELLLDGASLVELGRYFEQAGMVPGYECASEPGEGVVAGVGAVDGRPVYVFAQDVSVLAGSMSGGQAEKIVRVLELAERNGSPVVCVLDSGGSRVAEGAAAVGAYNRVIKKMTELSGLVPTVAVVAGPCIGAGAMLAAAADFTVAVNGSVLGLHSPQVLAAAGAEAQASARAVCAKGLAQFYAEDEAGAFALVRRLLSFLPQNNLDEAAAADGPDDPDRQIPELDAGETPGARELIAMIADAGQFLELYATYGQSMVTGFIRLNGYTAGVVANAGGFAPDACRKAARFISLLDAYHLPVLTLADAGDIQPGPQEAEMAAALPSLLYAYSQATTPMVTMITGKAVGAGLLAMCPRSAGADIVYAWANAEISALPAETAALIVYGDEIKKADDPVAARQGAIVKYMNKEATAFEAARQGVVDEVIAPSASRQMAVYALEACASKRAAITPPKKHGVAPL